MKVFGSDLMIDPEDGVTSEILRPQVTVSSTETGIYGLFVDFVTIETHSVVMDRLIYSPFLAASIIGRPYPDSQAFGRAEASLTL